MTVSGDKAKKHLREFNKQIRKEIIKGISKMKSAEAIKEFNKMFESIDDGKAYRPKKDFDELLDGKIWNIEAFRSIMKMKPRKPKSEPKKKPKFEVVKKLSPKEIMDDLKNQLKKVRKDLAKNRKERRQTSAKDAVFQVRLDERIEKLKTKKDDIQKKIDALK